MKQLYKYTLLRQDGSRYEGEPRPKMELKEMYEILGCEIVAVIPEDYYPDDTIGKRITIWGDDEARYVEGAHRNPHMKVLNGNPEIGEPAEWDCVGNLLQEEMV